MGICTDEIDHQWGFVQMQLIYIDALFGVYIAMTS
jgi:hypothetical protein